jgi:hypothetical protein
MLLLDLTLIYLEMKYWNIWKFLKDLILKCVKNSKPHCLIFWKFKIYYIKIQKG